MDKFLRYTTVDGRLVQIDLDDECPPSPWFAVYLDIPAGYYTQAEVQELALRLQQAAAYAKQHQDQG